MDNWCANDNLVNLLKVTNQSFLNTSLKVSHQETKNRILRDLNRCWIYLQLILATPDPVNSFPYLACWGLLWNEKFSTKFGTWAAHRIDLIPTPVWEYNWI